MSKYLYKYSCLREEFFENLMMRATPFVALNDPFEGFFNKDQFKDANLHLDSFARKQGHNVEKLSDSYLDEVMDKLQLDFDNVGVLSFSEDFTNPLMWAHYADDHKGIVLEFDYDKPLFQDSINELESRKSRFGKPVMGDIYEFPQKVIYQKEMPNFERPGQVQPNSESEYHWSKFLYYLFFTKSNDWVYEKELRSIVQLKDADRIICKENKNLCNFLSEHKEIKVEKLNDGRIQITYPNEYEMHEKMGDMSVKDEVFLCTSSDRKDNLNLFRINPDAISKIYCGYRCDYMKVKNLVEKNKQLAHLKNNIYRMKIDNYFYKLNSILVE